MTDTLPTVGAAMMSDMLPTYYDWLFEAQRDLEIQDAFDPAVLDGDWQARARQIRDTLNGYGGCIGIHGPFMSLTLMGYDPKIRAVVAERFRQALEFAAAIGASHMVVHSPFTFFGGPFLPHTPAYRLADEIDLVRATLESVLPLAEQARCTLVVENIFDKNPAPLLQTIRSFESEYVRMSLDTGHALIMQQHGGPSPDAWVRAAGDLLGHVHLQDGDGQVDRHWTPGNGNLNWFAFFEALGELDHQPRLIIEIKDKTQIRTAATYFSARGLAR